MGVMSILSVMLTANGTQFSRTMKAGKKDAASLVGSLKQLSSAIGIVKGVAAGFAGSALVKGFASMANEVMESVEATTNLANRADIAYNSLRALQTAAAANGSSAEEMNGAIQKMSIVLGEAKNGGAGAIATLNEMGLSATDFVGVRADEAFLKIVAAIKEMPDPMQRANAVQAVFGRGSAEMGNLLGLTADRLADYRNELERTGGALSDKQLEALSRQKDAVERLGRAYENLKTQIVASSAGQWATDAMNRLATGSRHVNEPGTGPLWEGGDAGAAARDAWMMENARQAGNTVFEPPPDAPARQAAEAGSFWRGLGATFEQKLGPTINQALLIAKRENFATQLGVKDWQAVFAGIGQTAGGIAKSKGGWVNGLAEQMSGPQNAPGAVVAGSAADYQADVRRRLGEKQEKTQKDMLAAEQLAARLIEKTNEILRKLTVFE